MLALVASDDAQMLGLLVSIEALVFGSAIGFCSRDHSDKSINMLSDLQRERRTGPAECIPESTTCLRRQQLVEARWHSLSAGFLK